MRYRRLDENGDYTFGNQQADFYRDQPEAVAQAVKTRLALLTGEWFLDVTEGTPYLTDVVQERTQFKYDAAIKNRILGTQGVQELTAYSSNNNTETRHLDVSATVSTVYGVTNNITATV